jgi:hypothetical protein
VSLAARLSEWLPILWTLLGIAVLVAPRPSGAFDGFLDRITKFGGARHRSLPWCSARW